MEEIFTKTNPWKLLLKYSIPSVIATSVQALYNIVDRIYIGKGLGTEALAGVTLTFPVFILSIAIAVLVGNGSSSIISIRLGEGKKDKAEHTLGNVFGLFIIAGIIVTTLGVIFLKPVLSLVGATDVTMPYAYSYLIWFLPFMTSDFLAMGTNGAIRSEGNPNLAMRVAVIGTLMNIILDPIFLFVFNLGVQGVAMATSISRVATMCIVIYHFTQGKSRHLTLYRKYMLPKWHIFEPVLAIGISPFSMNLATTLVAVFSNRALLSHGGSMAIGAFGAIQSIFVMFETPLRGLMMGTQPVIGFNYGAKFHDRVITLLKASYIYSLVISILGLAIVFIFGDNLIGMFSKGDPELVKMGVKGLRIYLAVLPLVGIHMMTAMYYQAIGKAKQAITLNLLRKVIIFLPALFLLPKYFGLQGVWLSTPLADSLACFIAISMIYYELKSYNKVDTVLALD
jgi:putative MATE family efflux protein